MNESLWNWSLLVVFLLGVVFFGSAVYAFVWARRAQQFENFEEGARSIFNDEEPEGEVTESFSSAFSDKKREEKK